MNTKVLTKSTRRTSNLRLYVGTTEQFVEDTVLNQISEKLKSNFFDYYRYYPSPSEVKSWHNSLRAMSQIIEHADLMDHGILLEYQLPQTSKRLDCMISGQDENETDNAVIVELKQWDRCEDSYGENEVTTWVGRNMRDVLHPSFQVGQYQMYLEDTHTAFYEGESPIKLSSCSYLHNYYPHDNDVIFSPKFEETLKKYPLYSADNVRDLMEYLKEKLINGKGLDIINKIEQSEYRPSKKLMDHISQVIKGKSEYILLDEQRVVFDKVCATVKRGFHNRKKTVFIIKGGPGTGKSVIALNLMADLLSMKYNAHYATGSKAFTETLRRIIGSRGSVQFKYFNSYMNAKPNEIDVLICDEAHRIRKTSYNRFTPRNIRSDKAQIEELLNVSKVAVFFIDDNQIVRPNEIGSVDYIREKANYYNCNIEEEELEAQFRCSGSDAFVNWVNNTLGVKRTANIIWEQNEDFDFKIFSSPEELEKAIKLKVYQGYTGRVTAGFCWEWSRDRNRDGTLKLDVQIGEYKRPWNARPDATRLAPNIPKASYWAYDPNGIDQVGCIYTAQGFEFDYVGVIFGKDLVYNLDEQRWEGNRELSHDREVKRSRNQFIDLVKNTYRVLLTRGMKGCYVYFMDKNTERFFKSRME